MEADEVRIHYPDLGVGVGARYPVHPEGLELVAAVLRHDIGLAASDAGAVRGPGSKPAGVVVVPVAQRGAGAQGSTTATSGDDDLDVAPEYNQLVPPPQSVGPRFPESAAPCAVCCCYVVGVGAITAGEVGEGGVDAHRGVGDGDLEHLQGAVAEEELGHAGRAVPAGDVEAREEAPGLHAERVRDADVAAAAGAAGQQRYIVGDRRRHRRR